MPVQGAVLDKTDPIRSECPQAWTLTADKIENNNAARKNQRRPKKTTAARNTQRDVKKQSRAKYAKKRKTVKSYEKLREEAQE